MTAFDPDRVAALMGLGWAALVADRLRRARKAAQLPAEARRGLPGAPQEPDFSDDFDLDDIPF